VVGSSLKLVVKDTLHHTGLTNGCCAVCCKFETVKHVTWNSKLPEHFQFGSSQSTMFSSFLLYNGKGSFLGINR
jgi:hypothetical protein